MPDDNSPAPPPAAQTVANGTRTERELELERALELERKIRKDREVSIAHLQDENQRLKAIPGPPPPPPAAPKRGGWTFFDED